MFTKRFRTTEPGDRSPRRRSLRAVAMIALLALAPFGAGRADVVPPGAVAVAEAWLALVDRGRHDAAMRAYFDPGAVEAAAALRERWRAAGSALRTRVVVTRSIRSWAGHGDGDASAMAPGAYFALVFDATVAGGPPGTDEVRLVPSGDDWKVVDYRTDRGGARQDAGPASSTGRQLR